jgi:exodeoxyribonuclease-3
MRESSAVLKIATWNVNGIRARAPEVLQWVEREAPDVLCLQEIKASPEHVPVPVCDLAGYWCLWHGYKGYSGVSLHLRKSTFPGRPRFAHPEFDAETRIVTARLGDVVVASVYVPNGGKDMPAKVRFLEGLGSVAAAARAEGLKLLLCGDLNVAREERDVHPKLRKQDQIGTTPLERELFAKILSHGLVDLGRKFAPDDDRLFTWWAPWRNLRERNIGWRIDYVLASAALAEKATACAGFREFGTSDHGPLQAVFDVAPPVYEAAPEPAVVAAAPSPAQIPLL